MSIINLFHPKSIAKQRSNQLLLLFFLLLQTMPIRFAKLLQVPLHIFNSKPTWEEPAEEPAWLEVSEGEWLNGKNSTIWVDVSPIKKWWFSSQPYMSFTIWDYMSWNPRLWRSSRDESRFIDPWMVDFYGINQY